jgi:hypothetical protein
MWIEAALATLLTGSDTPSTPYLSFTDIMLS